MSFTLAGKTPSELDVKLLEDLVEPGTPSVRKRETTIPGKAGKFDFGDKYDTRTFQLPLVTTGTNTPSEAQTVIRSLAELLTDSQGDPKEVELSFDHESTSYTVKLDSELGIQRFPAGFNKFVLPLVATDPYAKGTEETITKSITSSPEEFDVTNDGNIETPLVITITNNGGAVSNFSLYKLEE